LNRYDVVVVGGGAAGLLCAFTAGGRGRRVLVLEGSNKIGKKILMSGGGRCNFTNRFSHPTHFISANPKFCISALSRYSQWDFIELVERHAIPYHEKSAGQLFCDRSSRDILDMLRVECEQARVEILTDCKIEKVSKNNRYELHSNRGDFVADALVIATGGLSIPKMGASDFGYRLAVQFGHEVIDTRAGLVPLTFSGAVKELCSSLAGVSIPASVSAGNMAFDEDLLFTHRGLSGPAVLQISNYWQPGEDILVDLLPGANGEALLLEAKTARPKILLRSLLAETLPRALVVALQAMFWNEHAETQLAEVRDQDLRALAGKLHAWRLRPAGTEGYRTAEVTLGGVDSSGLSSQTLESRKHPGLYFIGEVVDVTGHLGGFNFQWAWSSGFVAGSVA
jgi:predicted Rossmann fold flavoprotein